LQGVKTEALQADFLPNNVTWLMGRPCYYPETLPVSLVRMGGENPPWLSFGVLPAELTRTAWWRIEKSLGGDPSQGKWVLPVGLANEYVGYVATREEYAAQAYEGASIIYGPNSAELLRAKLMELSNQLHQPIKGQTVVEGAFFYPERSGDGRSFGPDEAEMAAAHGDPDEALENLIVDEDGNPNRHWARFEWDEGIEIDDWEAGKRKVEILVSRTKEVFEDDFGSNFLTVYVNPSDLRPHEPRLVSYLKPKPWMRSLTKEPRPAGAEEKRRWIAIWLAPSCTDRDMSFYFRVTRNDGLKTPLCSVPFDLKTVGGWRPPHPVPPIPPTPPGKCP